MDQNVSAADNVDKGSLRLRINSGGDGLPVGEARVRISYTGNPESILEEVRSDGSGNTEEIELDAPPLEYSMEPMQQQPYGEYTASIQAEGFRERVISGIQLLPGQVSLQNVQMVPEDAPSGIGAAIVIPPHTLYGEYPPKIPEEEIKTVTESGEIVLSRVVIPETVVVHDGVPSDSGAKNYFVRYKDYIKNVASSEIYATWPDAALRANILAIMSFTLNRVYTEWYRGKGYNFTITSSTAYDHKFVYGRNIYKNISTIVDEMFENYLSRPGVTQPILTQYCDGKKVTCPNWMTQWGSKELADRGLNAIQILRRFYGNSMYINRAEAISGIPASWPGSNLTVGSTGNKVRQLQRQLARIAKAYPAIPSVTADGIYGPKTREAVRKFQSVFGLPATGVTDYKTWYEISAIYVAVTRIAELV